MLTLKDKNKKEINEINCKNVHNVKISLIPMYVSYQLFLRVKMMSNVNIVFDTMQPKSSEASHLYRPGM